MVGQLNLKRRRLRVPKYGAILEFLNFAVLLIVFVLCVSSERSSVSALPPAVGYTNGLPHGAQMRR